MPTAWFTGRGDDGTTGILASKRVSKSDRLIEAIGSIDELNSSIGVALSVIKDGEVSGQLRRVQNDLFVLGANLAAGNERKIEEARLGHDAVARLEAGIAELGRSLPQLKEFVLPGGSAEGAQLHMARAIARRAERNVIAAGKDGYKVDAEVIAYLNRLSSYLFAAALYLNRSNGVEESHPTY